MGKKRQPDMKRSLSRENGDRRQRKVKRDTRQKKKRRRKLIKRTALVLSILFFTIGIITEQKVYKIYIDTKEKTYGFITNMDKGTFRRDGNTYVYDKDNNEIGKLGNEKYSYVGSAGISDYIKNGYIAQEDRDFKTHNGINPKAIIRACLAYVRNHGRITQGGSTITQQVIKNNVLSQERTFSRKATEMLLAMQLERAYNKAQIMEYYCNSNYYGAGCYGVEGAAEYYFGKTAKDVTLAEAAMLVGISNRPNDYNPVASYEKAMKKKEMVLKSMLREGYIDDAQYQQALAESPKIVEYTDDTVHNSYMVSYAVHCATVEHMQLNGFEPRYSFDSQEDYERYKKAYKKAYSDSSGRIRSGGYKIYTSLDPDIQKRLQRSVKTLLHGDLEGAAACIDNDTQMVIAIVGGRKKDDEYNRGFLMERPPGSAIKPLLVYGPALNEGEVTAGSYVEDEAVDYNGYSPENADGMYYGTMTVREALGRSRNTVAVSLLKRTGIKDCMKYLQEMKFPTICPADSTMLSTALGGFTYGVKVVDMAKGYAVIAGGGTYKDNNCLLRLEQEDGSVLFQGTEEVYEVYNEDNAYILTDMMEGVFREEYGTARDLYRDGMMYAGKTGTTDDNKDAWFCGFSDSYTTAVWTGCDSPRPVDDLKGNTYPAEIWMDFMEKLDKNKARNDFRVPETVYLSNASGGYREVSRTDDPYGKRPEGFDYMSKLTEDAIRRKLDEKALRQRIKTAESKVREFEDFQIHDTDQALQLDDEYNEVLKMIEKIGSNEDEAPLKERAAYKYELLSGEVSGKWEAVRKQEELSEQKKKDLKNKEKAARSEEEAVDELKSRRKEVVEWYISALNERILYSSAVQSMIDDGQDALSDYEIYDDYSSLKKRFDKAARRARDLPTKEEMDRKTDSIHMPEGSDYEEPSDTGGTSGNEDAGYRVDPLE